MLKIKIGKCNVKVEGITYVSGATGTGKTTMLTEIMIQLVKSNMYRREKAPYASNVLGLSSSMSDEVVATVAESLVNDEEVPGIVIVDHAGYLMEECPDIYEKLIQASERVNLVLGGFDDFDITLLKKGDCYIKTGIGSYRNRRYLTRTLVYPNVGANCVEIVQALNDDYRLHSYTKSGKSMSKVIDEVMDSLLEKE